MSNNNLIIKCKNNKQYITPEENVNINKQTKQLIIGNKTNKINIDTENIQEILIQN